MFVTPVLFLMTLSSNFHAWVYNPPDVAITNESDMQAVLSGAYASLQDVSLYGRTMVLLTDLLADNVYISTVKVTATWIFSR